MTEQKFQLPSSLYAYQQEDGSKVAEDPARNWLLTHEMGVGKTPISIYAIEKAGYKYPLIVCPNSLRYEWARQIKEWTGHESAVSGNYYASGGKMGQIIRSILTEQYRKYRIINYETLRLDVVEILKLIPWDVVVFDEIHKLRNPYPNKLKKIVKGTWDFLTAIGNPKIIGLSGSPIVNYPNDLYGLLATVFPDKYPRTMASLRQFMYKYALWTTGAHGSYAYGSHDIPRLREETKDLMIRRTKKEVLPFLPDKYYQRPELEMQEGQRKIYNQMETELKILLDTGEPLWSPSVLSTLTRLRQINLDPAILGATSSSAKTEYILDLLESTNEKVVIFSCFEHYIELLARLFDKEGYSYVKVTGQVKPEDRSEAVRKFQETDVKIFLGTIQCAGEGITLTAASTVVLADRWWNEPQNQQAIDRLHRIGQKNAVQVILPIVKKSVDQVLDDILQRKHDASNSYYQESEVRDAIFGSIRYS